MKVLVLGAGQLARMMSLAGTPLNLKVSAYDVNSDTIVDPVTQQQLGTGLAQAIANADVITSEFEHIPYPVQELREAWVEVVYEREGGEGGRRVAWLGWRASCQRVCKGRQWLGVGRQ